MIDFDCLCHRYRFSVPSELAGDTIQCPECRRLNDIPTPDEAQRIDADGGYKVELVPDPTALDHDLAIRAYSRMRMDDLGEIDMRQTFDDVLLAGSHGTNTFDAPKKSPPRYDPFTGELIVPLKIKDEKPQSVIPLEDFDDEQPLEAVPITPKLEYSKVYVRSTTVAMASAFIDLLKPANFVVMVFVLIAHFLMFAASTALGVGTVAAAVLLMAIFAHYGNVIDEIGPIDRDELPVLMRNASFGEDLWQPFVNVIISLFIVFLPALCVFKVPHLPADMRWPAIVICVAVGCLAAPLVLLTMITSGAYANFRPDRLLAVLRICGPQYAIAAATFTSGVAAYVLAAGATSQAVNRLFSTPGIIAGFSSLGFGILLFAGAIYLMHAAAWQVGLLYRAHQPAFPWVLQRHDPVRLAQRNRPSTPLPAVSTRAD